MKKLLYNTVVRYYDQPIIIKKHKSTINSKGGIRMLNQLNTAAAPQTGDAILTVVIVVVAVLVIGLIAVGLMKRR